MARGIPAPPVDRGVVVMEGREEKCMEEREGDRRGAHSPAGRGSPSEGDGSISPDRRTEYSSSEEEEEVDGREGEQLYRQFLERRMVREQQDREDFASRANLTSRMDMDRTMRVDRNLNSRLDMDLSSLADRFSRSEGRQEVRRRAEMVELESLTQENFTLLLTELFQHGGVSQERVLVLFFFCSDLALRAVRAGLGSILSSTTRWTVAFLRGTVAAWIRCQGGWKTLLGSYSPSSTSNSSSWLTSSTNQTAFLCVCAAIICACAVYVKKNL